jgi:hypothetical protein
MLRDEGTPLTRAVREDVWARVRDRLDERPASRARVLALPAVAVALAIALVVTIATRVVGRDAGGPRQAEIVAVVGDARRGVHEQWRITHRGEHLELPARLRLDRGASAEVALPGGARLSIDASTTLRVAAREVSIERGGALHDVEPGHGDFVVHLGRWSVHVHGTRFWAARSGTEAAVCLVEGSVEVRSPRGTVATLEPGEGWRSGPAAPRYPAGLGCVMPAVAATPASTSPRPEVTAIAAAPVPGPPTTPPSPISLHPLTEHPSVQARAAAPEGAAREGAVPEGAAPEGAVPEAAAPEGAVDPAARGAGLDAAVPALPDVPAPSSSPEPAPVECAADPSPASCYRRVADGTGLNAETALVRLSQLRRQAGDAQGALDSLLEHRRRFARGVLTEEVDLAILEQRLAGNPSQALQEAGRFLSTHGRSAQLAEVRAIRAVLLHRAGRCADALADYEASRAGRVSARRRDEVAYGRASCLDALGRRDEARAAYHRYLEEFPGGRFVDRARSSLEATAPP